MKVLRIFSFNKLPTQCWALQPSVVNTSINLVTTNTYRIDLALKVRSCDVISPMHCLTSPKIVVEL